MLGGGILSGLAATARNFVGSYYDPGRLTTVQYPEQKLPPQENARTIPFLVYDGVDPVNGLRCTACAICAQECPAHCIEVVKDTQKKPDYLGKIQFQPKAFDIDISVCMGCGVCVEVCPFESIKMDTVFELAKTDRNMILHKADLAMSNNYYRNIHPAEAAAVDESRAQDVAKAQAKKPAAPAPLPV